MPKASQTPAWIKTLCVVGLLFLALRFIHLDADFPAHSLWQDESGRYTDEGWYGAAAIHDGLGGPWIKPGDFNPVVTIPVWPVLLHEVFQVTGVSMAAARALNCLFAIGFVLLASGLARRHFNERMTALIFFSLCASSTVFVFSRLALLEIAMTTFFLAAVLLFPRGEEHWWRALGAGVLFALGFLTKSSVLFMLPALLAYVALLAKERGDRTLRRNMLVFGATLGCLLGLYTLTVVRAHTADAIALSQQNSMVLHHDSALKAARVVFRMVVWTSPLFTLISYVAIVYFLMSPGRRRDPLFVLSGLWIAGFSAFMVLHYSADARYFVALVAPVVLLAMLLLRDVEQNGRSVAARAALGAVLIAAASEAAYTAAIALRPRYTFRDAAAEARGLMLRDTDAKPLVFGHGAVETSLFTHVDAIDDMGSMSIADKLDAYHPGWIMTWSDGRQIVDLPEVQARYETVPAGAWRVMDQPNRAELLLYRLKERGPAR